MATGLAVPMTVAAGPVAPAVPEALEAVAVAPAGPAVVGLAAPAAVPVVVRAGRRATTEVPVVTMTGAYAGREPGVTTTPGVVTEATPNLLAWRERMMSRAAVRQVLGPMAAFLVSEGRPLPEFMQGLVREGGAGLTFGKA